MSKYGEFDPLRLTSTPRPMYKTPSPPTRLYWKALVAAIAAILIGGPSSASAANSVKIPLANQSFGNGMEMTAHSRKQRIDPAKEYQYQVIAICKSTGALGPLVPARTKLASFMDSIAPEASVSLSGTLKNSSGKLPAVIANHTITSSEVVPGLGKVAISLKLNVKLLKSGKAIATISEVRITGEQGEFSGKIKFLAGSRIILTASEDGAESLKTGLSGAGFGNGRPLVVRSGKSKLLEPSAIYNYSIDAKCTGTGDLAALLPARSKLGDFMDSLEDGSSRYLSGSYKRRSGKKDTVLVNRTISGSLKRAKLSDVDVSLKLTVTVLGSGELVARIQQIRIRSGSQNLSGTIRMSDGAHISASTAAVLSMKSLFKDVKEQKRSVKIVIARSGNLDTKASVQFRTSDISARAGKHYTKKSGTIRFARGKKQVAIVIPITDDEKASGLPQFRITLSSPGPSCVLGEQETTVVSIQDND